MGNLPVVELRSHRAEDEAQAPNGVEGKKSGAVVQGRK